MTAPAPKRQRTDWAAVERDYRTGKFTLAELSEKYKLHHNTIWKRADKEGWTQDLSHQVRQRTKAKLAQEAAAVHKALTTDEAIRVVRDTAVKQTEVVVEAAAELNKQVILCHRNELRNAREMVTAMLAELRDAAMLDAERELLAQVAAGDVADEKDVAAIRNALQKALGLPGRIGGIKQLADALTKLHDGERRAYGLDDAADKEPPPAPIDWGKVSQQEAIEHYMRLVNQAPRPVAPRQLQ